MSIPEEGVIADEVSSFMFDFEYAKNGRHKGISLKQMKAFKRALRDLLAREIKAERDRCHEAIYMGLSKMIEPEW